MHNNALNLTARGCFNLTFSRGRQVSLYVRTLPDRRY